MRTKKHFLWMVLAVLVCGMTATALSSCGSDDDDSAASEQPNGPGSSDIDSDDADMMATPLTLKAIKAGTITLWNKAAGRVTYRVNGGSAQVVESGTKGTVSLGIGDRVSFYGDNATYWKSRNEFSTISCSSECYIYGNVMSLVNSTDFANAKTLTQANTFLGLFRGNALLKNHPNRSIELPATTLTEGCYSHMFRGCSSLTQTPELPALQLAVSCYEGMFEDCKSITKTTRLLAMELSNRCYLNMFGGCTSLSREIELPAMTLADYCYCGMFHDCTSLAYTPKLLAPTLVTGCYDEMFRDCTSLKQIYCLATTNTGGASTNKWVKGVPFNSYWNSKWWEDESHKEPVFIKASSASWSRGENGIPGETRTGTDGNGKEYTDQVGWKVQGI